MDKRKNERKQKRKEILLLKQEPELGVRFQKTPSAHVLVGNGGLRNGVGRALLKEMLSTPCQLWMPPEKDYAFASFTSPCEAQEVVKTINGACIQDVPKVAKYLPLSLKNGPPLHIYLSYVVEVPPAIKTSITSTPVLPPGLFLTSDFVTPNEEEQLMLWLDSDHTPQQQLKQRQVLHYGYSFNYDTNNVDPTHPLPGEFPPLIKQLISRIVACDHVHHTPDQLTINRYPPGAGL